MLVLLTIMIVMILLTCSYVVSYQTCCRSKLLKKFNHKYHAIARDPMDSVFSNINKEYFSNNETSMALVSKPTVNNPKKLKAFDDYFQAFRETIKNGPLGKVGELLVIAQLICMTFVALGLFPINIGVFCVSIIFPVGSISLISGILLLIFSSWHLLKEYTSDLNFDPNKMAFIENKEHVIATGPYSYVRHPVESGALLIALGLSLVTFSIERFLWTAALYFITVSEK